MQIRSFRESGEPVWVNAPASAPVRLGPDSRSALGPAATPAALTGRTRDRTRPMLHQVRKLLPERRPHVTRRRPRISWNRCGAGGKLAEMVKALSVRSDSLGILARLASLAHGYSICENGSHQPPANQMYSFSFTRVPPVLRRTLPHALVVVSMKHRRSPSSCAVPAPPAAPAPQLPNLTAVPSAATDAPYSQPSCRERPCTRCPKNSDSISGAFNLTESNAGE